MKIIILSMFEMCLLLFLLAHNKNDGEKDLFKRQKWKASDIAILILFAISLGLFLHFLPRHVRLPSLINRVYGYLFHAIMGVLLLIIFRFRIKQSTDSLGLHVPSIKYIAYGIITGILAYAVSISAAVSLKYASPTFELALFENIKKHGNAVDYGIFIYNVIIFGPIIEECIYRGMLYGPYRKKYGPVKAIIFVSLMFTAAHPMGTFIIAPFLLCILYEKTESLLPPIIAHSLFNCLSIYGQYLTGIGRG